MQKWKFLCRNRKKSTSTAQRYDFLLFDGFSNHCLANSVEPLRAANTISGKILFDWRFVSVSGLPVRSSSGLEVSISSPVSACHGDMLLVLPSYGYRRHCDWATMSALKSAATRYRALAGLDSGSWLLAEAGLLDGYEATIHWDEFSDFAASFPEISARRERSVIDRDRITCTGASAAFDLIHDLIIKDHGPLLGLEIAQIFMMRGSAADQIVPQNPPWSPYRRDRRAYAGQS